MDLAHFLAAGLLLSVPAAAVDTETPVKHLIVIFQENVSFDHYFGTYPDAENRPGERHFHARPGTPTVNGLGRPLIEHNPNSAPPRRLDRDHAATCDQDHSYVALQNAAHGGRMDRFVESTGAADPGCDPRGVMDYFDGNTVGALWRYAQRYAMSDEFFCTSFGPSTPGAINLVSGRTQGAEPADLSAAGETLVSSGTVVGDPDPEFDDCSSTPTIRMTGTNVGDLLDAAGVTWGWFEGGFRPTSRGGGGAAACGAAHRGSDGKTRRDYIPHHEPFQYYRSTANPRHLPPSSPDNIGLSDQAKHQYDLEDFWTAAERGKLPAVSFLKAPAYEDGHAGYSDPVHEQEFLVRTLNRLQGLAQWKDSAVIVTYDDSDGWYDHVMPPVIEVRPLRGDALMSYGPRLPLLLISPYAKENFVDHRITDQTSILRFIEDNWRLGRVGAGSFDDRAGSLRPLFDFGRRAPALILDPSTGAP